MATLAEALSALRFPHTSAVRANHTFAPLPTPSIYLEPEAPSLARWAWADGPIARFKQSHYLFGENGTAPPLGMRSAPPIGGLAAGTVELRADGSMHAWTIENASPAGSTKTAVLDDAVFGVYTRSMPPARRGNASGAAEYSSSAFLLRTHPPAGLPGVDALEFSGAMPHTRLHVPSPPGGLELTMYGRSRWRVGDMAASATPAAGFSLVVTNPADAPAADVSFVFVLPLQVQGGMLRTADGSAGVRMNASSAFGCAKLCAANASCASWSYANATRECSTHADFGSVPPAANSDDREDGAGVRGSWMLGQARGAFGVAAGGGDPRHDADCLVLQRPGTHAAAGNVSLCGAWEVEGAEFGEVSVGTADSLEALWAQFQGAGELRGELGGTHGAVAATVRGLAPGATASLSLALGWYLPHRDFMGVEIGNHYVAAELVADAEAAARGMLDAATAAAEVGEWSAFASALVGEATDESSLPAWLGDALLNSLHHTRSAMWLADGRWRQWESFSCVNVDSVHNDGERHIPYLMLWPEGVPSKMRGWAAGQTDDGMIQEQLACGCMAAVPPKLDAPCGRVMGDVSSMFIVYLLELWQWTADADLLAELWPNAKAAAQWQIARAAEFGLPDKLVDTYDGLGLEQYNVSCFSALFHLLAMESARALALSPVIDDAAFANDCAKALVRGRAAMDKLLWNETGGFYRSYTGGDALMSDSLYAQVLADSLGLGTLTTDAQVTSHLAAVVRENDTPYGLLCQTGRFPYPGPSAIGHPADNSVWMMANPNVATLLLWRGAAVSEALGVVNTTFHWWRDQLHDLWNVVALHGGLGYGAEGVPLANSHYGYHLVAWHILFAMSGQHFDAPQQALRLAPLLDDFRPFRLPVLVPRTAAAISAKGVTDGEGEPTYTLEVLAGAPLVLRSLSVHGVAPPPGMLPCTLAPGEKLSWKALASRAPPPATAE